ncbi:TonB-dependent receptor [Echinicola rosea]|uniref:TonB-dependent receptor n=1 Tax=Echinicola rosea TaxID=1807691 RepID=UPI00165188AF|nr:TonB-dependent receptor [Echinicola rosea]
MKHILPPLPFLSHCLQRNTIFYLLVLLTLATSLSASAQTGSISGKVTTSDGEPAEFSTVSLGNNQFTLVNHEGEFSFKGLAAGNYTLEVSFVGLESQTKTVQVKQGKPVKVNFILSASSNSLNEFMVIGDKYTVTSRKESPYVARLPIKNLENPQVYSVVDIELINEQMALTLEESFRNVPGAAPAKTGAGMPAFFSRGFQTSDNLRNGLATSLKTGIDLVMVERVEAIKGPSSTLFGASMVSFGGLVNYVTKKPHERFSGEVSYLQGSWDLSRITADINTPLNDDNTLLFRLNTAFQKENSFQDQGHGTTFVIAPSLTYKASDRLTFRLDADLQKFKGTSNTAWAINSGVTATSYDELPIAYDRSLIDNSFVGNQLSGNVFLQAEYKLSENWTSSTNYAYGNGEYNDLLYFNQYWIDNTTIRRAMGVFSPDKTGRKQFQQNFTGEFNIGAMKNRLVVGLDFMDQFRNMKYSYLWLDTVNVMEPTPDIRLQTVENTLGETVTPERLSKQRTYSAYFSDVLNLTENFLVMVSLRADRFANKGTTNPLTSETTGSYYQTAFSPKLGAVYQPVKDKVAIFANYMNGFKNVDNANQPQPDGTVANFKPQQANQLEGGVKLDLLENKLNATISYYDIQVTNSTRSATDENGATFTVQDGTQQSRGLEVEVIGNPFPGFNFVTGYGYNDNEYTNAAENIEGNRALGTPAHVANAWLSYSLLKGNLQGLGLGTGVIYVSDVFFNDTNTFTLPSYTVLDATLFYNRPKYRISIKANNLTDEPYWVSDGYYVRPQKPAHFITSFTFKF